eukprot:Tamp_07035.p1 GENE.Tamp_07035~~Tamp_07035.p1  ORF type:complete len:504 (+),score=106.82 Tamp_07035:818-2329(+)
MSKFQNTVYHIHIPAPAFRALLLLLVQHVRSLHPNSPHPSPLPVLVSLHTPKHARTHASTYTRTYARTHTRMWRWIECRGNADETVLILQPFPSADAFYIEFNGKPYSSMDTERCVVLFVKDILFLDHPPAADGSAAAKGKAPQCIPVSFAGEGHVELPSCPVCLERLDTSVTGIMTTICNHSFHCRCLSDWPDSSCPVCRYTQLPEAQQTGGCMHCGEPEDLWMCLVCGFMGCGRYRSQHALQHYHDSGHSFSIELGTQRVWDYTGDNYVHRLVANKMDGKLVELPEGGHKGQRKGEEDAKLEEALVGSKLDSVLQEYNEMLTRTLDDQRRFFEDRMAAMQEHWEAEIKLLRGELADKDHQLLEHARKAKERKTEEKKVAMLSERLKKAWEEAEFHKQCNVSLTENQQALNAKLAEAAKKDDEIRDLQDQVRDLMFFLEAQKSVEASDDSEDIRNGQIVMQASPAARRRKDKGKSPSLNRASSSSSSSSPAAGSAAGAAGSL